MRAHRLVAAAPLFLVAACDPDLLIIRTGAFAMSGSSWHGTSTDGGGIEIIIGFGNSGCRRDWPVCGPVTWQHPASGDSGRLWAEGRELGDGRVALQLREHDGPDARMVPARGGYDGPDRLRVTLTAPLGPIPAGELLLQRVPS
jgi:hypothetical protein